MPGRVTFVLPVLVPVLVSVAAAACGPGGSDAGVADGCHGLLAGDLVISEIMANPDGEDSGLEWFEIYNASGGERELRGLTLVAAHADGSGEKTHVVGGAAGLPLPAGGYLVVGDGDAAVDARPAYVDYGYGKDLGPLPNGGGRLALRCGGVELDGVTYALVKDGKSRGLNGDRTPDALANDDASRWCDATSFGSPGEANERCAETTTPGMCSEGGVARASVAPGPGDLVITEVMANPGAVADAPGEWFEVLATKDVDLNGLEIGVVLGAPKTVLAPVECVHVAAGTYLVFAHQADATQNGMLPRVDQVFGGPALANGNGALVLALAGSVLVAGVTWVGSSEGVALARDGTSAAFCKAVDAYGAGDRGTPGSANPACPVVVPDGMCRDGGGGGALRAIVAPAPGDLTVTEVMADPAAVADAAGEWIELRVTTDVDLNGLELGVAPPVVKSTLASESCLRVGAGTRVVLAHGDDAATNGGLPAVSGRFTFALGNGASSLFVGVGGMVLDQVTWTSATRGASTQLAPAACVTPEGVTYGAGDRGTPGAENVPCP